MKKLFNLFIAIGTLCLVFGGMQTAFGNTELSQAVTVGLGGFSAIMHLAPTVLGAAFNVVVIPDFTPKSISEELALSPEDLTKYLAEKNAHEMAVLKQSLNNQINEATKNNATKETIEAITSKYDKILKGVEDGFLTMKAQFEKTGKSTSKMPKNMFEQLKEISEMNEQFKHVANGGKQDAPIHFELKAAVTMGIDNTIEAVGSDSAVSVTRNTGIISTIRQRLLKYLSGGVSVSQLGNSTKAMWIEEIDEQGTPIFIGEGDDKTALSVRYEERDKNVRKIGVHGKVTTEMMRNLPSLINYIKNNLAKRVDIKTEDQLFGGNDTGDNLAGLTGYAVAFTGGGLTTTSPSYADVFRAAALQIEKAHGVGSAFYVSPEILAAMDVEKNTAGVYLLPPFRAANGNMVAGLTLISSNGLPTGVDFIGGDLSVVNVMWSDNLSIQIGLDGNDFTKNKKTILVEQELVQFVSANDVNVLVQGDMATAIVAITAP